MVDLREELPDGLPIGERWETVASTAEVRFPYDGSVVAHAPVGDVPLARRALEEAFGARLAVARLASHVRRAALLAAHAALAERRCALEGLLVLETGKPLADCRVEVERTLLTLHTSAEEVARLHGETVPLDVLPSGDGLLGFWVRKPIGRGGRHRRLQLPAAAGRPQGRPRPRGRLPGDREAGAPRRR